MVSLLTAIIVWGILILSAEYLLWWLFRRRALRIIFAPNFPERTPHAVALLRITAVVHTLFMVGVVFLAHFFLW